MNTTVLLILGTLQDTVATARGNAEAPVVQYATGMLNPTLWGQAAFLLVVAGAVAWFVMRSYSLPHTRRTILVRVFALEIFLVGAGVGAGAWFGSVYPPIFAIIATGILTFFGMLFHAMPSAPDASLQDRVLRLAITGSITTTYLALVGFGVFMRIPAEQGTDPIAQSLITSFSSVVGVVIAFYFGTGAYLEAKAAPTSQAPKTQDSGTLPG
jgi:hypothetical protein